MERQVVRRTDVNVLVEDYLDHACAPLVGPVPYARRRELREEWKAHLDALAEAAGEIGLEEEAALREAMRQFGDPGRLGAQWVTEWKRAQGPPAIWPAFLSSLAVFAVVTLSVWVSVLLSRFTYPGDGWVLFVAIGVPVVGGIIAGRRGAGRWAVSVACSVGALVLLQAAVLGIAAFRGAPESDGSEFGAALTVYQTFLWIPLGALTAEVTGILKERSASTTVRWAVK